MSTSQIVFICLTLFIGIFQFITAKMIIKKNATTKRDLTQNYFVKQWGKNALIFTITITPIYLIKPDKILYIVLVYLGLLIYNGGLLKKGMRKVNIYYPVNDPDGKIALAKKNDEIIPK